MNLKSFFQKNWQHFAAIAVMVIVAAVFYTPSLNGLDLKQHDNEQWRGMANEIDTYRELHGQEALWSNSMFGGMPAFQISIIYEGNILKSLIQSYFRSLPMPIGILIIHLVGFYIFCMFLRIHPMIAVLGAIAFSFASYEIIIVQAGHITKSVATAFIAPALGALIYAFKNNWKWGAAFFALFLSLELNSNHLQITYYFAYVLLFVGVFFLIQAIKTKKIKQFMITSSAIIAGVVLSVVANSGNLLNTSDYAKYTIRGENDLTISSTGEELVAEEKGLDKDYITNWSYGIGETFTFVSPEIKGGGSFPLGASHHASVVENSDLSFSEQKVVNGMYSYWGEQPFTSGPVYLGVVVFLLALLALVFSSNKIKWPLFAITVLAIMLSWGKNFMPLTDLFIDYIPGYAKFRTVTMILIVVELSVAVLGVIFLSELIKEREKFKEKKKLFVGVIGGFFVFMFLVKMIGLGDNYTGNTDRRQLAGIEENMIRQIRSTDPAVFKKEYGIDVNDPNQLNRFLESQMEQYEENFSDVRVVRKDIFHGSMNRSLIFIFLSGGLLILFVYTSLSPIYCMGGLLLLTAMDVISVSHNYIGDEERFWADAQEMKYPVSANLADMEILEMETKNDPKLKKIVEQAERKARSEASDLGLVGAGKTNFVNSRRFQALNLSSNYRVFDFNGGFQNSRSSFFHKSIGGYHGAKLRNINNTIDFHLAKSNEKVYDILNTKYFIQTRGESIVAVPRSSAMGNAWFVKKVEKHETANDEIRALGNKIEMKNLGAGKFLVNGMDAASAAIFGGESLKYVISTQDTIDIPLRSGLREGEEAVLVMDANGVIDLVPEFTLKADTASSFEKFVSFKVINEFKPKEEVVMLNSEAALLSTDSFSGEGTIKMDKYLPHKITYSADVKEKQFAVFSEIYYPSGWTAKIDGKEAKIIKSNYLLRGLEIPAGKHKIEFEFMPPMLGASKTAAYISSFLLFGAFIALGFFQWKAGTANAGQKEEGNEE